MRFQSETFVFKLLQRRVDKKHLMRFQSESPVFKLLQRCVDGKHLIRFQGETFVFKFLWCREAQEIGPLYDPVTRYGINYAVTHITRLDFQNKETRTSPARVSFGLKVPA